MRADNRGEGGILALLALALESARSERSSSSSPSAVCSIILRRQPLALFLFQKHRQRGATPASQCRCLRENPFFRMVLDWGLFPLVLLSSQS